MKGGVAQLAERRIHYPNVAGSSPAPATLQMHGIQLRVSRAFPPFLLSPRGWNGFLYAANAVYFFT
jgi:hypothetical protein